VTITGRYKKGEAAEIIRSHDLRLALFPIVWPETYSYPLSISLDCGLYPVAFDLGAIAERIRAMNFGHLLPLETSPEDINATLMACSLMSHPRPPAAVRPTLSDVLVRYYGEDSEQRTSVGKNAAQSGGEQRIWPGWPTTCNVEIMSNHGKVDHTYGLDSLPDVGQGPGSGGQSGDLQGLSDVAGADSESVVELLEEGQFYEAEVVSGVEDSPDGEVSELHTREVPEDDVPTEYLENENDGDPAT
jgi:hypothetical protein